MGGKDMDSPYHRSGQVLQSPLPSGKTRYGPRGLEPDRKHPCICASPYPPRCLAMQDAGNVTEGNLAEKAGLVPIKAVGDLWRQPSRWDEPIALTRAERRRAWLHSFFADHAFVRMVYLNFHKVTGTLWRSAQPTPGQLKRLAREGLKTVVSLRGGRRHGSWPLEVEACAANGLVLAEYIVTSRGAPEKETILAMDEFFGSLQTPVLIHCKSGADRAGFVAALFLIMREGKSADEALQQLSMRYGHFHFAPTGILDHFFESYRDAGESKGIPFRDWVRDHYNPEELKATFKPRLFSSFITEKLLHRE